MFSKKKKKKEKEEKEEEEEGGDDVGLGKVLMKRRRECNLIVSFTACTIVSCWRLNLNLGLRISQIGGGRGGLLHFHSSRSTTAILLPLIILLFVQSLRFQSQH